MRLLCHLGWHRPSATTIENEGRTFSRCVACGADLVKASHGWKTAPKGYKVIWKKPAPAKPKPEAVSAGYAKPPTRRKQPNRRAPAKKDLPSHLGGKDRRRSKDRRSGFGKKPDGEI